MKIKEFILKNFFLIIIATVAIIGISIEIAKFRKLNSGIKNDIETKKILLDNQLSINALHSEISNISEMLQPETGKEDVPEEVETKVVEIKKDKDE